MPQYVTYTPYPQKKYLCCFKSSDTSSKKVFRKVRTNCIAIILIQKNYKDYVLNLGLESAKLKQHEKNYNLSYACFFGI